MDLKELLRMIRLEGIRHIAVTGPEYSGTGPGAYILAKELKYNFVSEAAFNGDDFEAFSKQISMTKGPTVYQCPGLLHCGNLFLPHILLVVMARPLADIMAEHRRIGDTEKELEKYRQYKSFDLSRPIAYVKYQFAELYIAPNRRIEYLDYESISEDDSFRSTYPETASFIEKKKHEKRNRKSVKV